MTDIPISDLHYLYFIIPGFIAVWSYRYFTYSKEKGDYTLVGLSFFWGLFMIAVMGFLTTDKEQFGKSLENPYATALAFSFIGFLFAAVLSWHKDNNRLRDGYLFLKRGWPNVQRNLFKKKK